MKQKERNGIDIFLYNFFNVIEFKINIGDILTAAIALMALWYTIYSTKESQRKSVLPFIDWEGTELSVQPVKDKLGEIEDKHSDYKVFVNRNSESIGISEWPLELKNQFFWEIANTQLEPQKKLPNLPKFLRIRNVGNNVALSFSIKLHGMYTKPTFLQVGEEKIIAIFFEDTNTSTNIILRFFDIYGNEYKQNIEFYKGKLETVPKIKRIKFHTIKLRLEKRKAKFRIGKKSKIERKSKLK